MLVELLFNALIFCLFSHSSLLHTLISLSKPSGKKLINISMFQLLETFEQSPFFFVGQIELKKKQGGGEPVICPGTCCFILA